MPNSRYVKGRKKEYRIKKEYEKAGWIVLRTAGSHGFADLVAIHIENRTIRFIQCKSDKFPESMKKKTLKENEELRGYVFVSEFEVI